MPYQWFKSDQDRGRSTWAFLGSNPWSYCRYQSPQDSDTRCLLGFAQKNISWNLNQLGSMRLHNWEYTESESGEFGQLSYFAEVRLTVIFLCISYQKNIAWFIVCLLIYSYWRLRWQRNDYGFISHKFSFLEFQAKNNLVRFGSNSKASNILLRDFFLIMQ